MSKTTAANKLQFYTNAGTYIWTDNDINSYFRVAANHVPVTATAADITVANELFWKNSETITANNITSTFSSGKYKGCAQHQSYPLRDKVITTMVIRPLDDPT